MLLYIEVGFFWPHLSYFIKYVPYIIYPRVKASIFIFPYFFGIICVLLYRREI